MENKKNTFSEDLLDVIRIMIDKAMETTTRIYNAVSLGSIGSNKCVVMINEKQYRLNVVGVAPKNGERCKVFVPDGNFSAAFVMSGGEEKPTTATYTLGDGLLLTNHVLSVNTNELTAETIEDMWDDQSYVYLPSNVPNPSTQTITGSFVVGYGLTILNNKLCVSLDELTANNIETIWANKIYQMASSIANNTAAQYTPSDWNFSVGNGLKFENGVLFVNLQEITNQDVLVWWNE